MPLLLDFLADNFITLMILTSLTVTVAVGRHLSFSVKKHFISSIFALLLISVVDSMNRWLGQGVILSGGPAAQYRTSIVLTALGYILRPVVFILLSFIVFTNRRYRWFCSIPAMVNATVCICACFQNGASLLSDASSPQKSVTDNTAFLVGIIYLIVLGVSRKSWA